MSSSAQAINPERIRARRRTLLKDGLASVILCGPAVVLFGGLVVLPAILGFAYSLTAWTGWNLHPRFVGLENFRELFRDEQLRGAISFTLFQTALIVVFFTCGSLVLAVLLDRLRLMKGLIRGMFFYPYVLSVLVCALIFQYLANFRTGLINTVLRNLNLESWTQDWMMDASLAPYFIFALVAWSGLGFFTTLYLANLQVIPTEMYEAASIDGAGPASTFLHIQLRMLIPTITTNSVLALTTGINLFSHIVVTTEGGPGTRTFTVGYYIYWLGILNDRQGYAAAVSFAMFLVLAVVAVLQVSLLRRREVSL